MSSERKTLEPRRIPAWAALAAAFVVSGCAGFTRGAYWDEDEESGMEASGGAPMTEGGDSATGGESSGAGLSYEADIHDLLVAGCERCHSPNGSAGGTGFVLVRDDVTASYESTLDFVNVEDPSSSRLLTKTSGMGHGGGAIYDTRSEEYAIMEQWIEQGARP